MRAMSMKLLVPLLVDVTTKGQGWYERYKQDLASEHGVMEMEQVLAAEPRLPKTRKTR